MRPYYCIRGVIMSESLGKVLVVEDESKLARFIEFGIEARRI